MKKQMRMLLTIRKVTMNKPNPICSLLGLAARGRNLVSGEFSTEKAVKEGKAFVVIVAADASDNTRKKFQDMCDYRGIPIYYTEDKEALGHAIGSEMRASIAVTDEGLARAVIKKLEESEANGGNE